jgi:hypothetical protein
MASRALSKRKASPYLSGPSQAYAETPGNHRKRTGDDGPSLRAGHATAAAFAKVPSYRIQQHTRHKSAEMVACYVREADQWTKSGLKGVGF